MCVLQCSGHVARGQTLKRGVMLTALKVWALPTEQVMCEDRHRRYVKQVKPVKLMTLMTLVKLVKIAK